MAKKKTQSQRTPKKVRQKAAQKTERTGDLRVVGDVLELVGGVPSGLRGSYQSNHTRSDKIIAEYRCLKERLDELRVEFIPEAVVVSPCGLGDVPYSPWENFFTCPDFCGACRGEAERALALIKEGLVEGEASGPFMDSALIAERNAYRRESLGRAESRRERKRADAKEMGTLLGKAGSTASDAHDRGRVSHAVDFSSLTCGSKTYHLRGTVQRQIIELLYEAWKERGDGAGTMTETAIHLELNRDMASSGTYPSQIFKRHEDIKEILARVGPATWALYLDCPLPSRPSWNLPKP